MDKKIIWVLVILNLIWSGYLTYQLNTQTRQDAVSGEANTKIDSLLAGINNGQLLQLLINQSNQLQAQQNQPKK